MRIELYSEEIKEEWNSFVEHSRNGTFLFNRGYMDYHSDRFVDFSLILRDRHSSIIAALPANRVGDTLYSHQGLTYGGWVLGYRHPDANGMLEAWALMISFLRESGIRRISYRPVPHIYHRYPAEEDLYAIFRNHGTLGRCLVSSVIDLDCPISFNENSRRAVRRAEKTGLRFRSDGDMDGFYLILSDLLEEKYNTVPVHTLAELKLLQSRFPDKIRIYTVEEDGCTVAGTVIYHAGTTSHCQYIASSCRGQQTGALAFLFSCLPEQLPSGTRYLDLGTSNEQNGEILNSGLLAQKAGFGARAVLFPEYRIEI